MRMILLIQSLILVIFVNSFAAKYILLVGTYSKNDGNEKLAKALQLDLYKMQSLFMNFGFETYLLYDSTATLENVKNYLKKFTTLSEDDVFVFYFTGEGGTIKDISGDEEDKLDEIFIFYDYDMDKKTGFLVDDEFWEYVKKIKARKLLIIDACFSQSLYRNAGNKDLYIKSKGIIPEIKDTEIILKDIIPVPKFEKSRYVMLSASRENERAYIEKEGSIFTNSLVKVLQNWQKYDKNKNGKFEFKELEESVQKSVLNSIKNLEKKYNRTIPIFHPELEIQNVDENTDFFQYIGFSKKRTNNSLEKYLDSLINSEEYGKINIRTSKKEYLYKDFVDIYVYPEGNTGYLYIFYVDKDNYTILFPNKFYPKHIYLNGNETVIEIPGKFGHKFRLIADKPFGKTSVYAVILPKKLAINLPKNQFFKVFKKGSDEEKEITRGIKVIGINNSIHIGKTTFYVKEKR